MNDSSGSIERESEPDILSLLAAVAESWKLLLFGSLAVGIIAAGFLALVPGQYESRALLQIGGNGALLTAPNILRPVIEKLDLKTELSPRTDTAVDMLARRMRVQIFNGSLSDPSLRDKLPFLTEVTLTDSSPARARQVLEEIIAEVLRQSLPRDGEREDIEARLAGLRQAVTTLRSYAGRLAEKTAQLSPGDAENYTRGLALLVSDIETKQSTILELERKLKGLGQDSVIQPPTLPDAAVPQNKRATLLLTVMGTAFALLVFVLARDAYRQGMRDPVTATKLGRIKRAFSMARKRA